MKYHIRKEAESQIAYCGRKITQEEALIEEKNLLNPDGSEAYTLDSDDPINDIFGMCRECLANCYNKSAEDLEKGEFD